jgi:protein SCO1/2
MTKAFVRYAIAAVTALAAAPAIAFTPQDYLKVGVSLPAKAAVPATATVIDQSGQARGLRDLITRPAVLVFADYTCETLCGPIVAFVTTALEQSGLMAGDQFQLIVVGLDPKDGMADAARMRRDLGADAALDRASMFVTADAASLAALTEALGYRYFHDIGHDQFVHPAAAFVLAADGRVTRVLGGIGLSGDDMRLALVEAGERRVGSLGDQVRLLCSGFDPAHGTYNLLISRILAASALASIAMLGGGIGMLALMGRRRSS